jgi:DNA-binding SARP family transcriptional activator
VIALFAYLIGADQPQSREVLMELLFPRWDRDRAHAGLRRCLYRMRHALGDQWFEVARETVAIRRDGLWVDLWRFRDLLATRGEENGEEEDTKLALLREAVDLYRGEFLSGFYLKDSPAFDDWQFVQQESLRERCTTALDRLVDSYSARGRYREAIELGHKALSLDPLAEGAHRRLMRLYGLTGETAAAIRQYKRCRAGLLEELGTEPEPETVSLYRRILGGRRQASENEEAERAASCARKQDVRVVTVLAIALASDTALEETQDPMEPPEDAITFLQSARAILDRYGAHTNRCLLSEIVAVFGYPRVFEDDVERALSAALEVRGTATNLGLVVRQGVATGAILVHSPRPRQPTAMSGAPLQRGSRMRQRANPNTILCDRSSCERAFRAFTFRRNGAGSATFGSPVYLVTGKSAAGDVSHGIRGLQSPLVGYEEELARIEQHCQGGGRFLALVGEAGIGKSRLLREARELYSRASPSSLWLEGHCREITASNAYEPFRGMLASYLNELGGDVGRGIDIVVNRLKKESTPDGVDGESLSGAMSSVVEGRQGGDRSDYSSRDAHLRTVAGIKALLSSLCQQGPAVVVLEDVHWSDTLSADLICELLDVVARMPLRLICSFRSDEDGPKARIMRAAAARCAGRYTEIRLTGLDADQILRLVDGLLHPNELDPDAKELVAEISEGIPLYAEETVRFLINTDRIYREGGVWRSRKIRGGEITASDDMFRLVQHRVDALDEVTRQVLQWAAVIGPTFSLAVLGAMTPAGFDPERNVAELQTTQFVFESRVVPDRMYSFCHVLVQKAVYRTIPSSKRKELHTKVGSAIEAICGDDVADEIEVLAHHYELGGNLGKALFYLVRAAEKSAARYALHEAEDYYRRALKIAEEGEGQNAIRLALGGVLADLLRGEDAQAEYRNALEHARATANKRAELAALMGLAWATNLVVITRGAGVSEWIARLYDEAYVLAKELGDRVAMARAVTTTAWYRCYCSFLFAPLSENSVREVENALVLSREVGDQELELDSLMARTVVLYRQNRYGEAVEVGSKLATRLQASCDLVRLRELYHILHHLHFWKGRLQDSVECCDAAQRVAVEMGASPVLIPTYRSWPLMILGRFDEAWQSLEEEAAAEGQGNARAFNSFMRGVYHLTLLDCGGAADIFRALLASNPEEGPIQVQKDAASQLVRALIRSGEVSSHAMESMMADVAAVGPDVLAKVLCEYYLLKGELEKALQEADRLFAYAQTSGRELIRLRAQQHRVAVLLRMDRYAEVVAVAEDGARRAETGGYLTLEWDLLKAWGDALWAMSEHEDARTSYAAAWEVIKKMVATVPQPQLRAIFLSNPAVAQISQRCGGDPPTPPV